MATRIPRCSEHRDREVLPEGCPTCHRISIEADIVTRVVDALLDAGYELQINEDEPRPAEPTTDRATILAELQETDDDVLMVFGEQAKHWPAEAGRYTRFVRFVYGNDGHDVVADYSSSLEGVLAPVNAYADSLA